MIEIVRTDASNPDFLKLVRSLDIELQLRDGAEHEFFAQFNGLEGVKYAVVAYQDGKAVGCGAIKAYDEQTMEIKRMFVDDHARGKGIASLILKNLEAWTKELRFEKCILETGVKMPEAIALYIKNNYELIPNFGQYAGVDNSVCFLKKI
ncbi:GNAT family N-acetyltransferase [Flavobacterium sp. CYK-55]|uniref:GNAT family N-acetyltransferase n=1 Tax=Flavobacterium sp. CYK-55 TaxID=2835529 RepID=UPI001BD13443|nr:GNAT family N-acetyltransferase [Flavobacterium sp. CYK-55]MBS7786980.1 GNAT family N-acetyltransferase [Flavobacterium sp. CYK-55]